MKFAERGLSLRDTVLTHNVRNRELSHLLCLWLDLLKPVLVDNFQFLWWIILAMFFSSIQHLPFLDLFYQFVPLIPSSYSFSPTQKQHIYHDTHMISDASVLCSLCVDAIHTT